MQMAESGFFVLQSVALLAVLFVVGTRVLLLDDHCLAWACVLTGTAASVSHVVSACKSRRTQPAREGTCVFVESPCSGDVDRNLRYLMLCGIDAFARGEMPVATHSFMTAHPAATHYFVSDYADQWDVFSRGEAIQRGQMLRHRCDRTVFYVDFGMSRGMKAAMQYCTDNNLPYEVRLVDVERTQSMNAPLITRELVTAIVGAGDYAHMLRDADATVTAK